MIVDPFFVPTFNILLLGIIIPTIRGFVRCPGNLRWGVTGSYVRLCPAGVIYAGAPYWHPILIPWSHYKGVERVYAKTETTHFDMISEPPHPYGLKVTPKGLRVRRPLLSKVRTRGKVRVPAGPSYSDFVSKTRPINSYYGRWKNLPEDERAQDLDAFSYEDAI